MTICGILSQRNQLILNLKKLWIESALGKSGRVEVAMSRIGAREILVQRGGSAKRRAEEGRTTERKSQREYLDRESHYVWGRR